MELFNGLLIVTQILLATNEDDGETAAEMKNFGDPLCLRHVSEVSYLEMEWWWQQYLLLDVIEGIGRVNSKADQDDMRIWV